MKKLIALMLCVLCSACGQYQYLVLHGKVLDKFYDSRLRQFIYTVEDSTGKRYKVYTSDIKGHQILMPGEPVEWVDTSIL